MDAESLDRYPHIKYLELKRIRNNRFVIAYKAAAPSESSEGEGNR